MPTGHNVQAATQNQTALLRVFHLVRDEGIGVENGGLWNAVRAVARIFAAAGLLFTVNGCIATRGVVSVKWWKSG